MDKKEEKNKNSNRNELVDNVKIKEEPMTNASVKKHSEVEKKSHILGKVSSKKSTKKKNKGRASKLERFETVDDKVQENVENISIAMIICIVIICFVVGIALGCWLYDLAISNSNSDSLSEVIKIVNNI